MARDIVLSIDGDTRPLVRRLNKDIERVSKRSSFELNEKNFSQPLGRITGQLGEFDKALDASNARVLAFAASAGVLFAVQKGLQAMFSSMVNVEKKLADINVLFNVSEKSLGKFGDQLFNVAKLTGQSFDEVSIAATELARQGLSAEETLKRTRDALILVRLTGMDAADAVSALTAAMNSFSRAAIDTTTYVSKLAAVDAAFAVGSDDLANAIQRVGSSAQEAGVSLDQLIAIVTSAQQITARGGAVIGNSFKTIFTRIQRPRVLKQLEELGIKTQDLGGRIKPAMVILQNLAQTYDQLAQSQQAQIAELIGGVFQVNVLKASLRDLGKEFSLYKNALDISNSATDEAVRRNEQLNKTVSASLNKVVQSFTKFGAQAGEQLLGPMTRTAATISEKLVGSLDLKAPKDFGDKLFSGLLGGLGKFLGSGGLIIGLKILFQTLRGFTQHAVEGVRKLGQMGTESRKELEMQGHVTKELAKHPELLARIVKGEISVKDATDKVYKSMAQSTRELQVQEKLIKSMAGGMIARGVRGKTTAAGAEGRLDLSTFDEGLSKGFLPRASGGFVPNFTSVKDSISAAVELSSASYAKPSTKAVKTNIRGIGSVMTNSEEKIVHHPSFSQPFVNPPINSAEGRKHRKNAKSKTGVDPYAFGGFVPRAGLGLIPNFAGGFVGPKGQEFSKLKKFYSDYQFFRNKAEASMVAFGYGDENGLAPSKIKAAAGLKRILPKFYAQNQSVDKNKNVRAAQAGLSEQQAVELFLSDVSGLAGRHSKEQMKQVGTDFEKNLDQYLGGGLLSGNNDTFDFPSLPTGGAFDKLRKAIDMEKGYSIGEAHGTRVGHDKEVFLGKIIRSKSGFDYGNFAQKYKNKSVADVNDGKVFDVVEILGGYGPAGSPGHEGLKEKTISMTIGALESNTSTQPSVKNALAKMFATQVDEKGNPLVDPRRDRIEAKVKQDIVSTPAMEEALGVGTKQRLSKMQTASEGFIPNFVEPITIALGLSATYVTKLIRKLLNESDSLKREEYSNWFDSSFLEGGENFKNNVLGDFEGERLKFEGIGDNVKSHFRAENVNEKLRNSLEAFRQQKGAMLFLNDNKVSGVELAKKFSFEGLGSSKAIAGLEYLLFNESGAGSIKGDAFNATTNYPLRRNNSDAEIFSSWAKFINQKSESLNTPDLFSDLKRGQKADQSNHFKDATRYKGILNNIEQGQFGGVKRNDLLDFLRLKPSSQVKTDFKHDITGLEGSKNKAIEQARGNIANVLNAANAYNNVAEGELTDEEWANIERQAAARAIGRKRAEAGVSRKTGEKWEEEYKKDREKSDAMIRTGADQFKSRGFVPSFAPLTTEELLEQAEERSKKRGDISHAKKRIWSGIKKGAKWASKGENWKKLGTSKVVDLARSAASSVYSGIDSPDQKRTREEVARWIGGIQGEYETAMEDFPSEVEATEFLSNLKNADRTESIRGAMGIWKTAPKLKKFTDIKQSEAQNLSKKIKEFFLAKADKFQDTAAGQAASPVEGAPEDVLTEGPLKDFVETQFARSGLIPNFLQTDFLPDRYPHKEHVFGRHRQFTTLSGGDPYTVYSYNGNQQSTDPNWGDGLLYSGYTSTEKFNVGDWFPIEPPPNLPEHRLGQFFKVDKKPGVGIKMTSTPDDQKGQAAGAARIHRIISESKKRGEQILSSTLLAQINPKTARTNPAEFQPEVQKALRDSISIHDMHLTQLEHGQTSFNPSDSRFAHANPDWQSYGFSPIEEHGIPFTEENVKGNIEILKQNKLRQLYALQFSRIESDYLRAFNKTNWANILAQHPQLAHRTGPAAEGMVTKGHLMDAGPMISTMSPRLSHFRGHLQSLHGGTGKVHFDSLGHLKEILDNTNSKHFAKSLVGLIDVNDDGKMDKEVMDGLLDGTLPKDVIENTHLQPMGLTTTEGVGPRSRGILNLPIPFTGKDDSEVPRKYKGHVPNFQSKEEWYKSVRKELGWAGSKTSDQMIENWLTKGIRNIPVKDREEDQRSEILNVISQLNASNTLEMGKLKRHYTSYRGATDYPEDIDHIDSYNTQDLTNSGYLKILGHYDDSYKVDFTRTPQGGARQGGAGFARMNRLMQIARENGLEIISGSLIEQDSLVKVGDLTASDTTEATNLATGMAEHRAVLANWRSGITSKNIVDISNSEVDEKARLLVMARKKVLEEKLAKLESLPSSNWSKLLNDFPQIAHRVGEKGMSTKLTIKDRTGLAYASEGDRSSFDSLAELYDVTNKIDKKRFVRAYGGIFDQNLDGQIDDKWINKALENKDNIRRGRFPYEMMHLSGLEPVNLTTKPTDGPHDDSMVPHKSKGFIPNFKVLNPHSLDAQMGIPKIARAVKLKNGQVHYDEDATDHNEFIRQSKIDPKDIDTRGFVRYGKYRSIFEKMSWMGLAGGHIPSLPPVPQHESRPDLPPLPNAEKINEDLAIKQLNEQINRNSPIYTPQIGPRGKHFVALAETDRDSGGDRIEKAIWSASKQTGNLTGQLYFTDNENTSIFDEIGNYNAKIDTKAERGSGFARMWMLQKHARDTGSAYHSEIIVNNPKLLKGVPHSYDKNVYGNSPEDMEKKISDPKMRELTESGRITERALMEAQSRLLRGDPRSELLRERFGQPENMDEETYIRALLKIDDLEKANKKNFTESRNRAAELIEENFRATQKDGRSPWAKFLDTHPQVKQRIGIGGAGFTTSGLFSDSNRQIKAIQGNYQFKTFFDLYKKFKTFNTRNFNKSLVGLIDEDNDGLFDTDSELYKNETSYNKLSASSLGKGLSVSDLETTPVGVGQQDDSIVPLKSKGFVPNFFNNISSVDQLNLTADDIASLGNAGPELGEIRNRLLEEVQSGRLQNQRLDLLERV